MSKAYTEKMFSVFSAQFFEKAASNVKENVGEDVQTDQLVKEACRNCLEHVRKMHPLSNYD